MQFDGAWASLQSGWGALTALAVTYSFSVLGAIVLMVAGYIVAGLVERGIRAGLGQVHGFDATLRNFFSQMARYLILALVLVMVLGQFGVQTASIIAAIGAVGLAIGLALQGTLQNIAAGIMILILRPFRIGESIKVGAIDGDVEEVGLFATRLRAADGTYILAPNSKLWNEPVYNTSRNRLRRNDITFNIAYTNHVDRVRQMLADLAASDPRVKKDRPPIAFVNAVTDVSMAISLRYWTSDRDFLKTRIDLTHAGMKRLREESIRFPPPAGVPVQEAEEAASEAGASVPSPKPRGSGSTDKHPTRQ
jgi:small conductance mechanosensitive channel